MLSVLHRDVNGIEAIHEAEHVVVLPEDEPKRDPNDPAAVPSVWAGPAIVMERTDRPSIHIPRSRFGGENPTVGELFVMNSDGATIAKYVL